MENLNGFAVMNIPHYRTVKKFGMEKPLVNLVNLHVFFANIPDEAHGHTVCIVNE